MNIYIENINKQNKQNVYKLTNKQYLYKQKTTAKAGFNLNSIKDFIDMKRTFKNTIHNLIHIDSTIFCLQMSIQIDNVSKQGKNLYKQKNENYG